MGNNLEVKFSVLIDAAANQLGNHFCSDTIAKQLQIHFCRWISSSLKVRFKIQRHIKICFCS